jgi:hypothetical protein
LTAAELTAAELNVAELTAAELTAAAEQAGTYNLFREVTGSESLHDPGGACSNSGRISASINSVSRIAIVGW